MPKRAAYTPEGTYFTYYPTQKPGIKRTEISAFNKYFSSIGYRGNGREKKVVSITKEYVYSLYLAQNKCCAYSKIPINFLDGTASLDRIDSSKDYIESNVQWVHKYVNSMKLTKKHDDFLTWIERIYHHSIIGRRKLLDS